MKHLGQRSQVSVGWSRRTFLREGSGLAARQVFEVLDTWTKG